MNFDDMASGNRQQSKFDAKFKAMFETEDEKFQKLVECLEPLRENKVQVDSFTLPDLLSCVFLTSCQMIKHIQVLTTIPYKDVRDSVLAKANSLGICPLSHEMNLVHIYAVCRWMKTKTGIEAVVELQRSEKLKRRAASKGRTVAEAAMVRAFNAQFAEYGSELKKARAVLEKESDTGVRLRDKYWPVSAFDVATNILHEEAILDFCRKEGVKCGLYKYVEELIERKMVSFALREADNLRVVLKEMECFEVPVSSKDGNCSVGEKRKDIGSVLCNVGETSSKRK